MEKERVFKIISQKRIGLIKLGLKWLIDWNISLVKLLKIFEDFEKSELQGLINGTHKVQFKNKRFFDDERPQVHMSEFKKVLKISNDDFQFINSNDLKIVHIDIDNFQEGNNIELIIRKENIAKNVTDALSILSATMIKKYKDDKFNTVFYYDPLKKLSQISCWQENTVWICDALSNFDSPPINTDTERIFSAKSLKK